MAVALGVWYAGAKAKGDQELEENLVKFVERKTKYDAGKKLVLDGMVRELTEVSGELTAEVEGREKYSVQVTLREEGQWSNTKCSCPDGTRSVGKCKHVAAVLLKAWAKAEGDVAAVRLKALAKAEGDAWAKAAGDQKSKLAADSKTAPGVVTIDNDDDDPVVKPAAAASKPRTTAPVRVSSAPAPAVAGASAVGTSALAAGASEAKKRALPAWLSGAGLPKKTAAGVAVAAKAAALVAKAPPNKRKGASAADSDDAAKPKVPRSRATARSAPKRGKGAGSNAPSVPAAAEKVTDLLDEDMCMDFLEEEATRVLAESGGGSASPTHARKEQTACIVPSVGEVSRPCSAVPDTPPLAGLRQQQCWTSPAANSITASPFEARLGESSVQTKERCTVVDSDSDSDNEDPAEKFARRYRERNAKNKSEQNSQASPPCSVSGADASASASIRPSQVGGEGVGARKVISIESPSPEFRPTRAPTSLRISVPTNAAGGGSGKPVVSLADRRKALLGL